MKFFKNSDPDLSHGKELTDFFSKIFAVIVASLYSESVGRSWS